MRRRIEVTLSSDDTAQTVAVSAQLYLDRTSVSVARYNARSKMSHARPLDEEILGMVVRAMCSRLETAEPPLFDAL